MFQASGVGQVKTLQKSDTGTQQQNYDQSISSYNNS